MQVFALLLASALVSASDSNCQSIILSFAAVFPTRSLFQQNSYNPRQIRFKVIYKTFHMIVELGKYGFIYSILNDHFVGENTSGSSRYLE